MVKKALLIFVVMFLLVFLLWPGSKQSTTYSCPDDTGNPNSMYINIDTSCAAMPQRDSIGGGIRLAASLISNDGLSTIDFDGLDTYVYAEDETQARIFHIQNTALVALVISASVAVLAYGIRRTRRHPKN